MTTSSALIAYREEVYNFLQTVSIKYEPLAAQLNQNLINRGHTVDPDDPTSWKYYMNLSGEYHPTDDMMYIQSIDTQETIPFTKEMLAVHPRTAKAYVPGTTEYRELCARYAHQADLVKSIVYPVRDVNNAVSAENISLLSYGTGFLEESETDAIIADISRFLDYVANRWYFAHFSYEVLYPWIFYGCLWGLLAQCIFASRIKNLKTNAVHSYHIWELLTSEGLDDYSDILNRQQSLFLYQNIEYIRGNRGKQSNLRILVDNLLDPISIGMVGKILYQTTDSSVADECRWLPEFVSERVPTRYADVLQQIPPESMAVMTSRLYVAGDEVDKTPEYIDQEERILGTTFLNTFPTKVLEIRPVSIDRQYADILNMFLLDNLVLMINRGTYSPSVFLVDEFTGMELRLTAKDALVLYYYCIQKNKMQEPENLPTKYTSWAAFVPGLTEESIPQTFLYSASRWNFRALAPVNKFMEDTSFPPGTITRVDDFTELMGTQWLARVRQIEMARRTSDHMVIQALKRMDLIVSDRKQHTIELSPIEDYATWLDEHDLSAFVAFYDLAADKLDKYEALAAAILEEMIPINTDILKRYAIETTTNEFYRRLKELFIQLCSYNVVFLDTTRDMEHWVRMAKTTIYSKNLTISTQQPVSADVDMGQKVLIEDRVVVKGDDAFSLKTSVGSVRKTPEFVGNKARQVEILGETWSEEVLRIYNGDKDLSSRAGVPFYMNVRSVVDADAPT